MGTIGKWAQIGKCGHNYRLIQIKRSELGLWLFDVLLLLLIIINRRDHFRCRSLKEVEGMQQVIVVVEVRV